MWIPLLFSIAVWGLPLPTSFLFREDEEKTLRQLHQSAEQAMQAKEYQKAKDAYEELFGKVSIQPSQKYQVDWPTYIDIVLRLSEASLAMGDSTIAPKAVETLLSQSPPAAYLPQVKMMQIHFQSLNLPLEERFLHMQKVIKTYPEASWKMKELSFYHTVAYALDCQYEELIRKAKRYLAAKFYPEAISLYEQILEAISRGIFPKALETESLIPKKVRFRLAEAYFAQANYERTLQVCLEDSDREGIIDRERLYLSALCYQEKKEYENALSLFQQYVATPRGDQDHYDHALFEIGVYYAKKGNYEKAEEYFIKLVTGKKKVHFVACLNLARLYLEYRSPEKAETLLEPLSTTLHEEDPLRHECYFLKGEAAYAQKKYPQAREAFEKALPSSPLFEDWKNKALLHLAWTYVRLAEQNQKERISLWQNAEAIFTRIIQTEEEEGARLGLARLLLLRNREFGTPLTPLEELLAEARKTFSPTGQVEALLLMAEASDSRDTQAHLLTEAASEKYSSTSRYGEAWLKKGIFHLQRGLEKRGGDDLTQAILSFQKAFPWFMEDEMRSSLLKLEAKAHAYQNTPGDSLPLLETLLSQVQDSEREETLYLRGLIASHLPSSANFSLAESSLMQVISDYPAGRYRTEAFHTLGTLYFHNKNYEKALNTFTTLASEYAETPIAAEGWFWVAEMQELLGENPSPLRKFIYKNFPNSPRAPEAYFKQYSYQNYLSADLFALEHLKNLSTRFPSSPLQIISNYLLGINASNPHEAQNAFQDALRCFSVWKNEESKPNMTYLYFRYQAMLELAELSFQNGEFHDCEDLMRQLVEEFSQEQPYTYPFKQKNPYPAIYEEGEYTLVRCYLKQEKWPELEEQLAKMLENYTLSGQNSGAILSHVWQIQGDLAIRCEDVATAIRCYTIAEECGQEELSAEERLLLWIAQSDAHRSHGEYEKAMRLLSRVINTDIASTSRLEAMYKRAEIYELQGRPELALRQLEAAAKKSGEWALQAEEKLRMSYGIQ